ncbi:MAG: DUF3107 family protein [Actinobacteria bacterium]|uniref:Unannotated protein n=1 Tax=freshwater metagenome TaxID=449393 RepID=A0A6J5YT80_9ZZZZ|nr:DUF3107 family protein [Actinomycetota bacterium]
MEVRIGVQDSAREVVLESNQQSDEVHKLVNKAIASDEVLTLQDDKGRTIIVPGSKIAYVEIGVQTSGRVGFANN